MPGRGTSVVRPSARTFAAMTYYTKARLNRVGGTQVLPVLGRKVIKRQEAVPVLLKLVDRYRIFPLVLAHELLECLLCIGGKREVTLSITHKFCPNIEAKLDIDETRHSAPHDSIAWWSIVSTVEVSAQARNLVQIVG